MTNQVFGEAYETGLRRTLAFLLSRGVRPDLAPDVAQWAWMRGWERLELLRNESALLSWVNTIAWNHYRRVLRSRRAEEPLNDNTKGASEVNSAVFDVDRILRSCTEGHRVLFEAYLMGHTTDEIANQLGVSETAVRIRLLRARRSVRKMLVLDRDTCAPVSQAA